MGEPIIFISRWRLAVDRDTWSRAYGAVSAVIAGEKPRTALFAAYVDDQASETRIVHVFPDGAAMAEHFEGSEQRSASAANLLVPAGFEVYGRAPETSIEQLRRAAAAAGVPLDVFPDAIGGYLRALA